MQSQFPQPDPNWQWSLNDQSRVHLDLLEFGSINTAIDDKTKLPDAELPRGFSISDTEIYHHYLELIEASHLNEQQNFAFVVIINAVASIQFHQEIPAKNWYFKESTQESEYRPFYKVVSNYGQSEVLLLEDQGEFVLGMLLHKLTVSESKTLRQFSTQKIGKNRLFSIY